MTQNSQNWTPISSQIMSFSCLIYFSDRRLGHISLKSLNKQVWSPNVRCVPTPSSPLVTTAPPSSPPPPPHHHRPFLVTTNSIPSILAVENRRLGGFKNMRHGRWTYGRTDRRTDRRTDGRTDPLIEMRGRI